MPNFLSSDKYFKYHQAVHWAKDCPSSTVNTLKGGLSFLLPYDSPEKDTNSSTSFIAMLSNLGRCFRCHELGHWAKDCPLSADINRRGGEGPLVSANGISKKDVSATTSCIAMSSNSDQCRKPHQVGNQAKDGPSSIGINTRGELVSSDVLEKDTNKSTPNTTALLFSDNCCIRNQPRHLVNDYHSAIGINAEEGPVSFVTSDVIEKESETISTIHSESDANSTTNMTMLPNWDKGFECFQQGHWDTECPSSNGNNDGGEAVSYATCGIFEKDFSSTSSCDCMPSKSNKCFKCEQSGHLAEDCSSRVRNSYNCFVCNQQGHLAKDCPSSIGFNTRGGEEPISSTTYLKNDSNSTTNITMLPNYNKCFKCFQQGHWAKECPSSNGNNVGGEAASSTTCGIFKKDVNSASSYICMPSKSDKCFKCQQSGHWAKDCPSRNNVGGKTVSSTTSEIFNEDVNSTSSSICMPSKSDKCFKCQELGHWAKDCPSNGNSRGGPNSSSGSKIPQKICICGRGPCAILTSNTMKNPGRIFYKCPFRECGFFEWCDGQTSPSKEHNPPERFGWQQFTSPTYSNDGCRRIVKGYNLSTRCPCGAGPCPVYTAKTQKNIGRQFVSCPVRKGEGSCGFFKWCDELDSAASSLSSVRHDT